MSINLTFRGTRQISLSSLWRRPPQLDEALRALQERYGYRILEGGLLEFCPTGHVQVKATGGGIAGEFAGTPTGPGFHRAAVDFLTELGALLGLRMTVDDDTGYWTHRDFDLLQAEYVNWLKGVMEFAVDPAQAENCLMLGWSVSSWHPTGASGIATPTGLFAREVFRSKLEAGLVVQFAWRFFIWWDARRDALYFRGEALFLLWNEVVWCEPRFDAERELLTRVAGLLAKARELDPELPLPVAAWAEVLGLLGRVPDAATGPDLAEDGSIGYRRHEISVPLAAHWWVDLPGDAVEGEEENAIYYWGQGWEFYCTVYRLGGGDIPQHIRVEGTEVVGERHGDTYHGAWKYCSEGEGPYWILQGDVIGAEHRVVVTITWTEESRTDWAKATFLGVRAGKDVGRARLR
ncbi:MAG TPA: hypothetical protein VNT75_25075 [Symbiobacteriaceae bacterium]|nr:hypothetical protein [Symbiobacteriaceae bacterium]